jgi:flagellar hook-associated protein 1
MGLNAALATAGRSLELFTTGIQVAGQNIANATTPGYIRESLLLDANLPYRQGSLILGTGAMPVGVRQQIDRFLETRLHVASSDFAAARAREGIYKHLEGIVGELGEADLSTSLNNFLAAIHDVTNQPEVAAYRQIAVQQGLQLAGDIATQRRSIDEVRNAQSGKVVDLVKEANELIDQIQELNAQISKLEIAGLLKSDAGGLRTQRYNALNRLSEIIPIRAVENPDGSVNVFSGTDYLILAGTTQHFETLAEVDRGVQVQYVRLSSTGTNMSHVGGELRGVIEGRDLVLGGYVDQLDGYAAHIIAEFNRIHASGEGLTGFTTVTGTYRIDDPAAALNAAGLAFPPTHGSFQLKVTNSNSGLTETVSIAVNLDGIGPGTSLEDLRAAIDAVPHLSATITIDGRLKIDAATHFEFRFAEDDSGVLAALGINTFFTGSDSISIGVNAAVAQDQRLFASSQGGGPSDNRNAVELAQFADRALAGLNGLSLDSYYDQMISSLAQSSASETAIAQGFGGFRDSLLSQREQYSGVSLDEEAVLLLEFQRAYQASARMISIIDELYATLLSM